MDGVVLVMDYSAYERQRIRQIIDKIGHLNVVEVGDISQFLLMNSNIEGLKLVVLDLSFPTENDGFFVLKRIRTSSNVNVPIIVLSQSDRQELKVEALKYSVNDYIVKPYSIKRLDDSIRVLTNAEKAFHYNTENISDISMSFDNYVDREIKYSKRTGAPFSLILITTLQINAKEVSDSATIEPISGDDKASILAMAAR
ncbi:MAG: response regulator, partial [Clostridiaceae bacterium]|nr:response regulator [Clostridiaceae bacterium]